ncbi:hypothetical protein PIB30_075848 [Stylosanthes scabra]|uniref:GDSL esterase/lipase n=1 Tax=Stylosanthes scabra TaxID=79078 RepID=A0ABU6SRD9_9FABA|nr:hypothetical protein [Stylosanthes scabra]
MATMVVVIAVFGPKGAEGAPSRAFFVFGDSLVDSGNNNYLPTTARADSRPYGIDYPTHRPTGRFSNGFNLPDIISQRIGSEPTLPYLSPELNGQKLLIGANFASAGIGILNDTGIQFVRILRMYEQYELFQEYQVRLSAEVGSEKAKKIVNGALVLITLGGNDFVNNYFVTPFSLRSRQFNISQFSRYLITEYAKILLRLYELGARRVLVSGTGPLGCVPSQLASKSNNGECVPELQEAANIFNPLLVQMTKDLNSQVGSDVFVAVNAFVMHMDFVTKPEKFGFVTSKVACCGQGKYNGIGTCNALSNLCPNRDVYAFWDAFHPTQRALRFIVDAIFAGTNDVISPMNLTTIMALDSNNI